MVHVIHVQADADIRPDRFGQRQRLVVPVEEVGLEAVERLERHTDTLAVGVLAHFVQALDRPLPLFFGRGHGLDFADLGGDDAHHLPAESA